jgi:hypothetical protein
MLIALNSSEVNCRIAGITVRLDRTIDQPCGVCGETAVMIGPGAGPHVASLRCICCDRHRGWLPKGAANFIDAAVVLFGRPVVPVTVKTSQYAPSSETAMPGAIAATSSARP